MGHCFIISDTFYRHSLIVTRIIWHIFQLHLSWILVFSRYLSLSFLSWVLSFIGSYFGKRNILKNFILLSLLFYFSIVYLSLDFFLYFFRRAVYDLVILRLVYSFLRLSIMSQFFIFNNILSIYHSILLKFIIHEYFFANLLLFCMELIVCMVVFVDSNFRRELSSISEIWFGNLVRHFFWRWIDWDVITVLECKNSGTYHSSRTRVSWLWKLINIWFVWVFINNVGTRHNILEFWFMNIVRLARDGSTV